MPFLKVLLILGVVSLVIIPPAGANSAPPVTTVKVYFERDTIPVNQPVMFTVNCSAYDNPESNPRHEINELGDIFSFSAVCPSYGCFNRMYEYLDYPHLTQCALFGELNGEQFTLLNVQKPFSCSSLNNGRAQSCKLHINLSSAHYTAIPAPATNISPSPADRIVIMETPTPEPVKTKGIFDDVICFLKNLIGGTC